MNIKEPLEIVGLDITNLNDRADIDKPYYLYPELVMNHVCIQRMIRQIEGMQKTIKRMKARDTRK